MRELTTSSIHTGEAITLRFNYLFTFYHIKLYRLPISNAAEVFPWIVLFYGSLERRKKVKLSPAIICISTHKRFKTVKTCGGTYLVNKHVLFRVVSEK